MIAARRERAATRAAERLLSEFVLPPGARHTASPREYGGVLRRSGPEPAAEVVDVHHFWSVRRPLRTVADFVTVHRLHGFELSGRPGVGPRAPHYITWSFVSPSERAATRFLNVSAVRLPNRTVLRVDAKVVWIYPRSPREKVPSAVREIVVRAPRVRVKVTDPGNVARIAHWFDALPISPPGVVLPCPLVRGLAITVSFNDARGSRLAEAKVPPTPAWVCDQIEFTIGGHPQRPLIDRAGSRRKSFVGRLRRLLGVRLLLHYS